MIEVTYQKYNKELKQTFYRADVDFWVFVGELAKNKNVWAIQAKENGEDFIFSDKLEEVLF